MKTLYINEAQKKKIKKVIAAQDQVGGKVNAGIMGAVTGMMCEVSEDGDEDILGKGPEVWYRGYTTEYNDVNDNAIGVPPGCGIWLTDSLEYATNYAKRENGKVAKITINESKVRYASEGEAYDLLGDSVYDGSPECVEIVRENGYNAWQCYYYNEGAYGLCLADWSPIIKIEDYDGPLNEDIQHQERMVDINQVINSSKFKAWFGDWENNPSESSKVVDESGRPLIVHHGSPKFIGVSFDKNKIGRSLNYGEKGVFCTTQDLSWAKRFSYPTSPGSHSFTVKIDTSKPGDILSGFLNMRHPLDFFHLTDNDWTIMWKMALERYQTQGFVWNAEEIESRHEKWLNDCKEMLSFNNHQGIKFYLSSGIENLGEKLKENGYDGYIALMDNKDTAIEYCFIEPNQFKSIYSFAFDVENNSIFAENVEKGKYKIGFESGGMEPVAHITENTEETITLYHGVKFDGMEFALTNNRLEPRVCSEGGPKAIWLSEKQYHYPFTFELHIPRRMVEQMTNVDYIYTKPISLNEFGCKLIKTSFYVYVSGFAATVNLLDKSLFERQCKILGEDFLTSLLSTFEKYPEITSRIIEPALEAAVPLVLKESTRKKKIIKNDEGEVVPEICPDCGGKVGVYIQGEPVYLCSKCKKYFGTMPFTGKLNEGREFCEDFNYKPYLKSISDFMVEKGIDLKPYPKVVLHREPQEGLYIRTGYYDPEKKEVHLFLAERHAKDVLRSFAHEMIHHSQNLRGALTGYNGDTLEGDNVLEKLESEAYLKGNIYFRKWTEELHPTIPNTKKKLNESIQDVYDIADDVDCVSVEDILSEFFTDKRNGVEKKHWNLIPAEQYKNLLTRYMQNPSMARIPENIVYDWFANILIPNAFAIDKITTLANHNQWYPVEEVAEQLEYHFGNRFKVTDSHSACDALYKLGFFKWSSLPDGSDGWSDYGIGPIFNELAQYKPNMDAGELLILINRVLHIGHWRGDLASAFIEGGSKSCSDISGILRESVEAPGFAAWFGNSKVVDKEGNPLPMYHGTNSEFTAFSKDYFSHGSDAYLGVGFNFTSSKYEASGYGENIHEVYLRAERPMTNKSKTISLGAVMNAIKNVDSGEDPDGSICTAMLSRRVVNPTPTDLYNAAKAIYDYAESDGDIYSAFGLAYSGSNDAKITEAFKSMGFDSCIDYDKYSGNITYVVVFEPNQIKSVNAPNFNPESDETIDEDIDMLEDTNPEDVDLSSFEPKKQLNPRFWKNGRLDSRVRVRLLDIADDFIETLNVPWVNPSDIIMTGSLANFNWSKEHSDIDLHVVMDFDDVDENVSLVKDYFDSKKKIWNDEHQNLTIGGFPVEVYVQDISEEHASSGVYSLEKDKWLVKPSLKNFEGEIDSEAIKARAAEYMNEIDDLESEYEDKIAEADLSELHEKAVELFKRIKAERKNGFENGGGEFNTGNLIFKTLRRNGYIGKLSKLKLDTYDASQSLLNENITEGVYYHYIRLRFLNEIIKNNRIKLNTDAEDGPGGGLGYLSLTRNRSNAYGFATSYKNPDYRGMENYARIEFDKSAFKNIRNSSIKPYDFFASQFPEDGLNGKTYHLRNLESGEDYGNQDKEQFWAQGEDRLIAPGGAHEEGCKWFITNAFKYINRIDIMIRDTGLSDYEELVSILNQPNYSAWKEKCHIYNNNNSKFNRQL